MKLTDDQYVLQLGGFLRIRSRSKAAEDMGRGRAKKDREDPDWRKRCHVSPEWSVEDRQEQSRRMKALWHSPEYADRRQAARERLRASLEGRIISEHSREVTRDRMLMGGAKDAVAARKIMQPEKVAERIIRDAAMAEQYYTRGMRVEDIAKLHGLEISYAYRIIRKTPI